MGLQLATASVDGVVKIWNIKRQQCVNTFEMHNDKIWTMDLFEQVETIGQDDHGEDLFRSTIHLVTGGCDSTIKVWKDHTEEQEQEDREAELKRIQEEQKLSHLIREQDYMEAAVLAFKLNKLRDFYHVLNKIISKNSAQQGVFDQVDSVIKDMRRFEDLSKTDFSIP
jgi:U3 small nucleolar RNA-associated protein 13